MGTSEGRPGERVKDVRFTDHVLVVDLLDGRFDAALPAGSYTLVPQPVDGLMGTGESQDFTIEAGAATTIDVAYDTGIR